MSKKLYCNNDDCGTMGWDLGGCSPLGADCRECGRSGVMLGKLPDRQLMVVCATEIINAIHEEAVEICMAIGNVESEIAGRR